MTAKSVKRSDVAIIGGGILGMLSALHLVGRGRSVSLIEKGRVFAEASGVNAGSLGVQNKLAPLIPYTLASFEIWRALGARLGCDIDFHQTGGFKIATSADEVARLQKSAEGLEKAGLKIRWMEAAELRREAPWLSGEVVAATSCEADGFASPLRFAAALRRRLAAEGADLREHCSLQGIEPLGEGIRLITDQGRIEADQLLIAAGAWSGEVAAKLGVSLPVSLDVNMVSVTEPAPLTIARMVTHARGILTLKQVSNGSCLIGGGWQGVGSLVDQRKELDFDQIIHNLRLAQRIVPGLGPLHLLRSWAGYEGVSPDSLPYLGRLPGYSQVYVAACARGGFTLGPALTDLLVQLMCDGKTAMSIAPFSPERLCNV